MKKLFTLILIVNSISLFSQQISSKSYIKTENSKIIYQYTENSFELSKLELDENQIELQTENGKIKKFYKGHYNIFPEKLGVCRIVAKNKETGETIFKEIFHVYPPILPEIIPVWFSEKTDNLVDNKINKDRLEDFKGVGLQVMSPNNIIFFMTTGQLKIYHDNSLFKETEIRNGIFDETIRTAFESLESGDYIIIKNIKIGSVVDYSKRDNPDALYSLKPVIFFIE